MPRSASGTLRPSRSAGRRDRRRLGADAQHYHREERVQKYKSVTLTETQLEDMVRRAPDLVEEGLRFVDHQRRTTRGPLDVLLADSANAAVVAELKEVEDDGMLGQALDYLDYVSTNREGIARAYRGAGIDPRKDPRLFLIAPSFSVTMLHRCKWIDADLSLYRYKCIQLDGTQEIVPVYLRVDFPYLPSVVEEYDTGAMLDHITDPQVRGLAEELIAFARALDPTTVEAEPRKAYVSIKRAGKVIGYLEPRRTHFVLTAQGAEGSYVSVNVSQGEHLEAARKLLQTNFDFFTG